MHVILAAVAGGIALAILLINLSRGFAWWTVWLKQQRRRIRRGFEVIITDKSSVPEKKENDHG